MLVKKYEWLVMSNCDPDHHDDFNRWYDDVHIADLLKIPGIVGARRSRLSKYQSTENPETGGMMVSEAGPLAGQLPYLAVYEFETDNVQWVLDEIVRRAGTPDMEISEHLREVNMHLYEKP